MLVLLLALTNPSGFHLHCKHFRLQSLVIVSLPALITFTNGRNNTLITLTKLLWYTRKDKKNLKNLVNLCWVTLGQQGLMSLRLDWARKRRNFLVSASAQTTRHSKIFYGYWLFLQLKVNIFQFLCRSAGFFSAVLRLTVPSLIETLWNE